MTTTTDNRSSEEIERDIRATQKDMHRTVEQIEGELTGRNMLNSLLDKADENGVDTRYLIDAARRNPLALGMIAVGGLWLVSDADARPSAMKPSLGRFGSHDLGMIRDLTPTAGIPSTVPMSSTWRAANRDRTRTIRPIAAAGIIRGRAIS